MVLLGVLLAAVYAGWMRRAGAANGGGYALGTPFAWIALTLIMFTPYIAWRIVEDVRYTSSLNSWIADRYGVSVVQVHPAIFDAAAAHMSVAVVERGLIDVDTRKTEKRLLLGKSDAAARGGAGDRDGRAGDTGCARAALGRIRCE